LVNIRETLLRKSLFKELSHLAKIRWKSFPLLSLQQIQGHVRAYYSHERR
jgi:hypothetical protein